MTILDEFRTKLTQILSEVFPNDSVGNGYAPEEITAIEEAHSVHIPSILRICYETAGKHRAFTQGLEILVPLDQLQWHSDFYDPDSAGLIFFAEQQGINFYVLDQSDLDKDDPPVFQGDPDATELELNCSRLSSFLLKLLCWNAIEVCPSSGNASIPIETLARLEAQMTRVECGEPVDYQLQAFQNGSRVACIFQDENADEAMLYVASQSETDLKKWMQELDVPFDSH